MAFPQTRLPITVELQINGTWTDVSGDVRSQGGTDAIRIQRGITASGGVLADKGTCSLTLDNNSGAYSSRNPRSPYFGFLGRNTPLRVGVAYGTPWLNVSEGGTEHATTPDATVLDITGDIDVRLDFEPAVWGDYRDHLGGVNLGDTDLIGKEVLSGNQRSWRLVLTDQGRFNFGWSTDGAVFTVVESAQLNLPPYSRLSVRATLDVDNGAGGSTVTFYTSGTPGTAGPWTQLGTPIVTAGVTSIFNSTAPLEVGDIAATTFVSLAKKIFSAEVRNGINGTIVANPNFEAQAVGAASFNDTAPSPRAWTVTAGALTNVYRRFTGEVSEWPPQWDTGGKDVTTPITASGILRRYSQSRTTLQSTLRRRLGTAAGMIAYWPMEEGSAATQASSPLPGVQAARTTGFSWAADSSLVGSAALPQLAPPSSLIAPVPAATGDWHVELVYNLASLPAAPTLMLQVNVAGSAAAMVQFSVGVGVARIQALTSDSTVLATNDVTPDHFTDGWGRLQVKVQSSGGNVNLFGRWALIGTSNTAFVSTSFSGVQGRVTSVSGVWGSGFSTLRIGHLAVFPESLPNPFDNSDMGFDGESAAVRMSRVASEQALPMSIAAHAADTELVGPQAQDTLLNVLTQAAQADESLLHEAREFLGLRFRGRRSLENQPSALDLPYVATPQALMAPLTPVDDDQATLNDSTVSRTGGSSTRAEVTTGPLSTQPPPAGVGTGYDESVTLNLHSDDQTWYHAWWRTFLGTWDEARFPQVNIELAKNPGLIPAAARIDTGSRIRITAPLPAWLPPDPIDQLVLGYSETIAQFSWRLAFAGRPYGPYRTGVLDDAVLGVLDTDGSQLAVAATSTTTALTVETTGGPSSPYWTTNPADFPFNLRIAGEVVTATACTSAVSDSFTRTATTTWGTATTGQAWTSVGGLNSDYSVNGSAGVHSLTSVNVSRHTVIGPNITDFDVEASFATSVLAAGGSQFVALVGRYTDANNLMMARVEFTTAQAVIVTIRKRVGGTETQLSTATTTLTHAAGTLFRVRFTGFGSTFQARVWLASGTEPGYWHTTASDTSITAAGQVGARSVLASTNTNTLPVTVTYDDFALLNPQTITVTRSVNGISKSQAAGTAVALDQPLILAL